MTPFRFLRLLFVLVVTCGSAFAAPSRVLAATLVASPPAVTQDDDPVVQRAHDISTLFTTIPTWEDGLFDPSFLEAVPPLQLRTLCAGMHARLGEVVAVHRTSGASDYEGRFDIVFDSEQVVPTRLGVSASPPHPVVTLWFGPPEPLLASWDALDAALDDFPGQVTFAAARLGRDAPHWLAQHHGEQTLAIGSAFKLWVLGELAARIHTGDRAWSDVVRLRQEWMSLPSGQLQAWPDNAPVTLHTLASLMISVSDNTATDHLMHILGREAIEARMQAMGCEHAERNRPLLTTRELFSIKLSEGDDAAQAFLRFPGERGRRAFVEQECPELPISGPGTDPGALALPAHVDAIEWFASAADLCRTLNTLRLQGEDDPALLDVLAINPGLPAATGNFDLVAYKGGSEPGVLAMAFLVRRDEHWWSLAMAWNDPAAVLDKNRLYGLVSRALLLLAGDEG